MNWVLISVGLGGALVFGIKCSKKLSDEDVIKIKRFSAKSIGFGYIYGLLAKSYIGYAKTSYGIDVTLEEIRNNKNAPMV